MKSRIICSSQEQSETGYVIAFCALLMMVIFGITSFVIDIGNARYQLRNIQIAADASSMAALLVLGNAVTGTAVRNEVVDIAARNRVNQSEISLIECGIWNSTTKVFATQGQSGGLPVCNNTTNAVRVSIQRQVNTFFGRILNTNHITPSTSAIASTIPINQCSKPYVLPEASFVGLELNDTLIVSGNRNGTWGQIEYGQTGNNYSVTDDVCSPGLVENADPGPRTSSGYNSTGEAFCRIFGTSDGDGLIIPITTTPLASNKEFTVTEFVKVDLVDMPCLKSSASKCQGCSGNNYSAEFRLVARNVNPNPNPVSTKRTLVK